MAYETGIDPQALLDAPPEVLREMMAYRGELAREAAKLRKKYS